jgi:hypothetical protein
MKEKCIVLNASKYSFVNKESGELREGVTFGYLITENLESCGNGEHKGYKIAKGSFPLKDWTKFKEVPAYYDLDFEMSIAGDGRPEMKVKDIEYVSNIIVMAE